MAKVTLKGDAKLTNLKQAVETATEQSLDEIGARAVELIREELTSGPRSTALVPDAPSADWTDQLAASLGYQVHGDGKGVSVTADAFYAQLLELGTLETPPRPFIGPVLTRLKPEIDAIVARAFGSQGKDLKGSGT